MSTFSLLQMSFHNFVWKTLLFQHKSTINPHNRHQPALCFCLSGVIQSKNQRAPRVGTPAQAAWQWRCRESHVAFMEVLACPWRAPGAHPGVGAHSSPGGALSLCSLLGTGGLNVLPRGPGRCNSCSHHIKPGKQLQFLSRSGQRQVHFPRICWRTMGYDGTYQVLSTSFYYK